MIKKICRDCKKDFLAISGHQILCNQCNKIARKKEDEDTKKRARKSSKKRYLKNPDYFREKSKGNYADWYKRNKKVVKKYMKEDYKKNKEKWQIRAYASKFLKKKIFEKYNGKCAFCNFPKNLAS